MDQEPSKRRRGGGTPRKRAGQPAEGAASKPEIPGDVPDVRPEGNEVPGVQEDAPVVPLHDPRAAIADGLAALLTPVQVTFLLQEVLAITKRVPITGDCTNCGQPLKVYGEVPDAKAVVSALTDLINHGFGRPDVAKMERDMIQFRRFTDFTEWEARDDDEEEPPVVDEEG